jgi:hypothetical protein
MARLNNLIFFNHEKNMRTFTHLLLTAGLLAAGQLFATDPAGSTAAPPLRKVAIIVENRAGAQLNDKVAVFEDLLSSRIAGKGYSIISRDVTVNALKTYPSVGVAVSSQSAVQASAGTASHTHSTAAVSAHDELAQASKLRAKAEDASGTNVGSLELAQTDSSKYPGIDKGAILRKPQ